MLRQTAFIEMTPPTSLALMLGANIRARRKAKGMTLVEMGRAIGTTPQTAQRLETANMTMSIEWLEKIAAALGVDPSDLFDPDESLEAKTTLAGKRRHLRARARTLHAEATNLLVALQAFLDQTEDDDRPGDE
jgi:transcriptional regulator with XRE-family HTH domain